MLLRFPYVCCNKTLRLNVQTTHLLYNLRMFIGVICVLKILTYSKNLKLPISVKVNHLFIKLKYIQNRLD